MYYNSGMFTRTGIWLRTCLLITGLAIQAGLWRAPNPQALPAELISQGRDGSAANGWSDSPALSYDGRLAAFVSLAGNLTGDDSNQAADVFVFDRRSGETRRVSVGSHGEQGDGWSYQPALSGDGSSLAFTSLARNWEDGSVKNPPGQASVYLHDLASGQTRRISQAPDGSAANGWSGWASISADGRWVAYASLASNLTGEQTNGVQSIYLYDRASQTNRRIAPDIQDGQGHAPLYDLVCGPAVRLLPGFQTSFAALDCPGEGLHIRWSYLPAISGDGRFIAYLSQLAGITGGQAAGPGLQLMLYDRISGQTRAIDTHNLAVPISVLASRPALSGDGSILAFAGMQNNRAGVYTYQLSDGAISLAPGSQLASPGRLRFTLEPNGQALIYLAANENRAADLVRYDLASGHSRRLGRLSAAGRRTSEATQPAISAGGQTIAYAAGSQPDQAANPLSGIFLLDDPGAAISPGSVTGWVSDPAGRPLAGVRVSDNAGRSVLTDQSGRFSLPGRSAGASGRYSLTLAPSKKGFSFSPPERRVTIQDAASGANSLNFIANPEALLEAARADLGMPYNLGRGCPSPFRECGGPFSGFYSGDCTDLVLDAFREGLEINLQFALELDFQANPYHYYRWRNARSSQDMWRYFAYSGQLLAPQVPYLPGDIVFFDWEGDGEMDHVSIISEVNSKGYPRKMIDATGVIEENPGGLATELEWRHYHDQHTYGHARWQGLSARSFPVSNQSPDWLLVAVDGPAVTVRLTGAEDQALSPGSLLSDLGTGRLLSVNDPLNGSGWYFVEVSSLAGGSYQFGAQAIQSGQITDATAFERRLAAGESEIIAIQVQQDRGKLTFKLTGPGFN